MDDDSNRDNIVIRKDNTIIRKTKNKFDYKQNQLMALLLGKYVNLNTDKCIDTNITIEELRLALGIKSDGGSSYEQIRQTIDRFGEKSSVGIYKEIKGKPKYVWMPFFTKIELKENAVEFKWNLEMKPYLIGLKQNYTQYLMADFLNLKSVYSQYLYEVLKSVENFENRYHKKPIIDLDELRNILGIEDKKAYMQFNEFNKRILKKSINEINDKTDLDVSYTTVKKGRVVVAICFDVSKKSECNKKDSKERVERNIELSVSKENSIDESIKEKIKGKDLFNRPTLQEVKNFCIERKNNVDAEQFFYFYESNGWMISNNPMMNWKACIITWEKRHIKKNNEDDYMDWTNVDETPADDELIEEIKKIQEELES